MNEETFADLNEEDQEMIRNITVDTAKKMLVDGRPTTTELMTEINSQLTTYGFTCEQKMFAVWALAHTIHDSIDIVIG